MHSARYDNTAGSHKRKLEASDAQFRKAIMSTSLPMQIQTNLKGRSRVAVRTVGDLETYVDFITALSLQYREYSDHKKVRFSHKRQISVIQVLRILGYCRARWNIIKPHLRMAQG